VAPLDSSGPLVYTVTMHKTACLLVCPWLVLASGLAFTFVGCGASEDVAEENSSLAAPADVAAAPADAMVTPSGLASKLLVAGSGTRYPQASDRVRVHYTGWQTDGTRFDTSLDGAPAEFNLGMVIRGWTEGLQLMVEGERRRFWIPEELAYAGARDRPSGMLVFDVELIAIVD